MWQRRKLPLQWLLAGVFAAFAASWLLRPLWFDEVINLTNFAYGRSPLTIYRSYVIPNNHILFSVLLSFWSGVVPLTEGLLRLLPAGFAVATLLLGFRLFRVRLGSGAAFLVLLALAVTPAFLIYGTALRGYMQSMFFTMLALDAAMKLACRASLRNSGLYFLWCWCAVATIPSNLFALGAAALYAVPLLGNDFWKKRAFYLLGGIPFAALGIFYGPIRREFFACAALKEGWSDPFAALSGVNAAMAVGFCMLFLPAVWGAVIAGRRTRFHWIFSARILVFLLPAIPCMVFPVAPFPRTFFPFFFVAAMVAGCGLKHLFSYYCRLTRRWNGRTLLGGFAFVVICWGALFLMHPSLRMALGWRFGGVMRDDFFAPYYTLASFDPAALTKEMGKSGRVPFYATFGSDPYALGFYAAIAALPPDSVRFDNPRGRVALLPPYVVLRVDEKIADTARRFGRAETDFELICTRGFYQIWRGREGLHAF